MTLYHYVYDTWGPPQSLTIAQQGFNVYLVAYKELFQNFDVKLQNLGYGEPYN